VVFLDDVVVKIQDAQVANRLNHAAIGVTLEREKDTLGLLASAGGLSAKL
jgi:putative transposase